MENKKFELETEITENMIILGIEKINKKIKFRMTIPFVEHIGISTEKMTFQLKIGDKQTIFYMYYLPNEKLYNVIDTRIKDIKEEE